MKHTARAVAELLILSVLLSCATVQETTTGILMAAFFAPMWIAAIPIMPFAAIEELSDTEEGPAQALFLPDGEHLLITYRLGREQHLYRVNLTDGTAIRLTEGHAFDQQCALSPDGTRTAFTRAARAKSRRSNLYVVNTDGSDLRQITHGESYDMLPQFSPDSQWVVFVSATGKKKSDLYLVGAEGSELHRLTDTPDAFETGPQFLPDGRTLLFWRATFHGHYSPIAASDWHSWDLWRMDVESNKETRLTAKCYHHVVSIAVSPDGQQVVYDVGNQWKEDLWSVETFGTGEVRPVVPEGEQYRVRDEDGDIISQTKSPVFSPDGRHLLFALIAEPQRWEHGEPYNWHLLDLDTNQATQLTDLALDLIAADFSSDGNQVVFLADADPRSEEPLYQVWLMRADGTDLQQVDLGPVREAAMG